MEPEKFTLPKADAIVPYMAYSTASGKENGVLLIFGDSSSPKMALLCAGFPDDHTVFLPFGKALSEQGILVGIMCLPGFDDRPEDGVPWESHPREGFSFDETAAAVREASKALKKFSTYPNTPEFTGIFHDWGVIAGTMWAHRLEKEAKDNGAENILRPHKVIFFDVLASLSRNTSDRIPRSAVPSLSLHQKLCYIYQVVLAICSVTQQYLSRHLAAAFCISTFSLLNVTGLFPMQSFDMKSRNAVYGDRKPGILRFMSMTYMYRNTFAPLLSGKKRKGLPWDPLHQDWKTTPILYLYGKDKNTIFHSNVSLAMLEREEREKRSLSRAVGIEGAGHFLYVQKQEECLKHVLGFIQAENTFA